MDINSLKDNLDLALSVVGGHREILLHKPESRLEVQLAAYYEENKMLRENIDRACNALTDSICASGNDAETNLLWVRKLRAVLSLEARKQMSETKQMNLNSDYEDTELMGGVSSPDPKILDASTRKSAAMQQQSWEDERPVLRSTAQLDRDYKRLSKTNPGAVYRANRDNLTAVKGIAVCAILGAVFWAGVVAGPWVYEFLRWAPL